MHKTNGNMSGQHRRTKWANRHFHGVPMVCHGFWKLHWAKPENLTDQQMKTLYESYKSVEAYYNSQQNRDRGRREGWKRCRRALAVVMKQRGIDAEAVVAEAR
jgi:hypothetical protein